jgi:hypothetical protein
LQCFINKDRQRYISQHFRVLFNRNMRDTRPFPVRYAKSPDSRVSIQGKTLRNIIELARATFRTSFRNVYLDRSTWCFYVQVVDADKQVVSQFMDEYKMTLVENTFSSLRNTGKVKLKPKTARA